MDVLNSYGVRLLMPFSGRWFYGDALYIVDPWLYLALGGGIWMAARAARAHRASPTRPARVALVLSAAYMVAMLASNVWARAVVRDGLTRAGRPPDTRFMVTPVPVNPFRREVLVDTGDRYEKGFIWFEPVPHFRPAGYGVEKGPEPARSRGSAGHPARAGLPAVVALSVRGGRSDRGAAPGAPQRLPLLGCGRAGRLGGVVIGDW